MAEVDFQNSISTVRGVSFAFLFYLGRELGRVAMQHPPYSCTSGFYVFVFWAVFYIIRYVFFSAFSDWYCH